MKKKGARNIPDFSARRPPSLPGAHPEPKHAAPPTPRTQTMKPRATSAKSGRRGQ